MARGMGLECACSKVEHYIKVTLVKIKCMAKGYCIRAKMSSWTAGLKMDRCQRLQELRLCFRMGVFMMETTLIIGGMGKVCAGIQMERCLKVSGRMIKGLAEEK